MFIRTVNKHSEKTDTTMGSATVVGGSARMSVEGMGVLDDEGSAAPEEVFVEVNKCGCTNFFVKVFIGVMIALTILFLGINVAVADDQSASGAMFSLAIVFFISSIVGCNILCCACCQQPKGADD